MHMVNRTIVAYPPKAEWPDKSSVCFNISFLSEEHTASGDFKKLENRAVWLPKNPHTSLNRIKAMTARPLLSWMAIRSVLADITEVTTHKTRAQWNTRSGKSHITGSDVCFWGLVSVKCHLLFCARETVELRLQQKRNHVNYHGQKQAYKPPTIFESVVLPW